MAIEEAVMQLDGTIKELIKTLKNQESSSAKSNKQTEEQADLEEVRSSLIQLKETKDHQTAKAVLKKFGVQKVQDLPVKEYQRCIDLCRKETS